MSDQPDKLDLTSHDAVDPRRQEVLRLFPDVHTEGGKIDFDRLKLALGEMVDTGRERYGMTWPGKADCFRAIQAPSLGTLRPCPEESVNFATTENLIIEGDNLEVLKLLQKSYLGKVKMIYIDPPYNTGNDFIYPDNFSESLQTYLEYTGQVDAEGRKFGTNTETDGRFHSKWMNMMYPRLYLARNLLREDGVIFISIDDSEIDSLKKLASEIFGEENFVAQLVWKNKYNSGALTKGFSSVHEYILCFSKLPVEMLQAPLSEEARAEYKSRDSKYAKRGGFVTQPLATGSKDTRPNLRFPIVWNGNEIWPEKQWIWSRERVEAALANDEIVVNESEGRLGVRVKQYLRNEDGEVRKTKPLSLLVGPYNQEGSKEIEGLLGPDVFDFPKPCGLIRFLLSITTSEHDRGDGIILDFMAGSGTTAHAVLDLNKQDAGNRKFILVQLPEPTDRSDYPTIAEITKERVRRVIKKLNDEDAGKLDLGGATKQDRGFRVFKLAESNFTPWDADAPPDAGALARQLQLHVAHVRDGRTPSDLLYEILLKSGIPISGHVDTLTLVGKPVHAADGGKFLICLETPLTLDLVRAMAGRKPERVVCLDAGFADNDQLKANAVQIFRAAGVTSFKTV
ncbi:MAG: site-specific DNA-methyltransferase [Gemmatimonadaceae bacterium]